MSHRIREAMRSGDLAPFGAGGGMVEVDETFIGREPGKPVQARAYHHKMKVLALVDREHRPAALHGRGRPQARNHRADRRARTSPRKRA